jgi:hypothetical protein
MRHLIWHHYYQQVHITLEVLLVNDVLQENYLKIYPGGCYILTHLVCLYSIKKLHLFFITSVFYALYGRNYKISIDLRYLFIFHFQLIWYLLLHNKISKILMHKITLSLL